MKSNKKLIILPIILTSVLTLNACDAIEGSESTTPDSKQQQNIDKTDSDVVRGVVTDKYVKRKDDEDVFYIVVEDDQGETHVLENDDVLIAGKFDSADVQARVKVGKRYRFETMGVRIPFMSVYPHITKFQKLN